MAKGLSVCKKRWKSYRKMNEKCPIAKENEELKAEIKSLKQQIEDLREEIKQILSE